MLVENRPASGGQAKVNPDGSKPGAQPPPLLIPFTRAAYEHTEPFYDSGALAWPVNKTQIGPIDVPAFGFARGVWLDVQMSGGTGVAAVAKEDAPFSVLGNITLADVSGAPIVGPMDGYDLFIANLLGSYWRQRPDVLAQYQSVQTTGDFRFLLWIPLEVGPRDALGALPNGNSSQTYKLGFQAGGSTDVYSTNPTGFGTLRIRAWLEAWTQPNGTDLMGNMQATMPPAVGTTQFWTKYVNPVVAGANTIPIQRVGNLIRNIAFILRTTAPARSTANWPDPAQLFLDGRGLDNLGQSQWRAKQSALVADTPATAWPTGVFVKSFSHDFDGLLGWEMRDLWLPTTQGSRLELQGSFGAAGTLVTLVNDVVPNGDPYIT